MITIVGMGPGNRNFIVPYAINRIKKADILVGGKRNLAEFKDVNCQKVPIDALTNYADVLSKKGNIVILASGDPSLYGITEVILRYVMKDDLEIIPGISSVQYMCAKLKITMNELTVISLHGRSEDLAGKIKKNGKVAVFTDDTHTPQYIARLLKGTEMSCLKVYVGENLSYENEVIYCFDVDELSESDIKFGLNLVMITCGNI